MKRKHEVNFSFIIVSCEFKFYNNTDFFLLAIIMFHQCCQPEKKIKSKKKTNVTFFIHTSYLKVIECKL